MKTASLVLLLLTFFPGCSPEDPFLYQVDPRLEKYVVKFFHESEIRGKKLTRKSLIVAASQDLLKNEKRLAVTRGNSGDQIIIEIDEDFVQSTDTLFLEFAMMHEFGHAYLKREHIEKYSIMNPAQKSVDGYKRNEKERQKLMDELFH